MPRQHTVTIFPRDPQHRLVGPDLATFLDRVSERMAALGDGALGEVRAGTFHAHPHHLPALLEHIDAARAATRGRHDLSVRLRGDARERFYRYLGERSLDLSFEAFVLPRAVEGATLCGACSHPLDLDGAATACGRRACGAASPGDDDLHACWWLELRGDAPTGIGERFVRERRRLEGTPFFEALQGAARSRLVEWHRWS